jgi:PAS domain S-box-containing protein
MFREIKILYLNSSLLRIEELNELFRNYFPIPADITVAQIDDIGSVFGQVHDLIICDFTTQSPETVIISARIAELKSRSGFLIFSYSGTVTGLPPGSRAMLYSTDSEGIKSLLPLILPGLGLWLEVSLEHDKIAIERQLSEHIINNSRSMLSIINRDYVYERVNDKFSLSHGCQAGNLIGKSLMEIWGKENFNSNIKPRLDDCFRGRTIRYEASFDTPAGGRRSFEVIFRPFFSVSGTVTHLLAETFDISDVRGAEAAFQVISEQLSLLKDNIPVGYLRCLINGDIIHINNACREIFRIPVNKELTSLNFRNFYSDSTLFSVHVDHLMTNASRKLGRVNLITQSNEERICSLTAFISEIRGTDPVYIDFAVEDMSREIILETKLRQAQRLETVGALAGGIAHDFNNILTTVYGYAEMSVDDLPPDSPVTENMARIIMAVGKARSLTSQILTFSRQIEQEKVRVDPMAVLNETIDMVRSTLPDNVVIIHKPDCSRLLVFADPTQLFRVFLNLLNNSVQAMEGGEGVITVDTIVATCEEVRPVINLDILADNYLVYSISDTGTGMDQRLLDRIFEPFFTTREVGKGTGLGLSVVHGIVAEIGGEIAVSSVPGEGTVFRIFLPVLKDEIGSDSTIRQKERLLFISRNRYESRVLSLALENAGYSVVIATGAEEILQILTSKKSRPDLILFPDDIEHFSFYDMASVMKKIPYKVPLILITDSQDLILRESLLISDFIKHFLIKPVSLKEVITAIEIALTSK